MRAMAMWALVHETADEGWKAAVQRGSAGSPGDASGTEGDFVDALSAAIHAQKELLKAELAAGESGRGAVGSDAESMNALRFEIAELKGRIETLQTSVDALVARGEGRGV